MEEKVTWKEKITWKQAGKWVVGVVAFWVIMSSFYIISGTEYAVYKAPNGTLTPVITGGVHFKIPVLSEVTKYDMVIKTTYVDDDDSDPATHGTMKRITFSDTYGGMVGGTLLYRLSPDKLTQIHMTYHNQENLIESGLKPISKQLLAYTANQFSGEAFMQGGQNEYQNRVEDQANNGLLVTKREKDIVTKSISTVGLENQNPVKRDEREEFVFVTKIQYDENGEPLRSPLAISGLGITLAQVTIDDFKPDLKLREFIERKQNQIAARQDIIEKQENARQGSILSEATGEKDRVEAKQAQLKEKEIEIIKAQKKVELEQKEAELQVVKKQKDLDVAEMEKKIQKAKAESTIYQAKAIRAQGLAEAEVIKAKYDAYDRTLYSMEIQRDTMLGVTKNLQGITVKLPHISFQGGASGGAPLNSVDTVMNTIGMQKLEELANMKVIK